jgi:hypothetical protein
VKLFVESAAILAPGLAGWKSSRAVLAGEEPYQAAPLTPPVADLLPAVERRRTGSTVKFALAVGHEALATAGRAVDSVATVFVSSGNDGDVINEICTTLAGPDRQVSPTRFHNSVHNAPSGYWGIATRSHQPSTSLCGFEWSFAIGLLEAAAHLDTGRRELLLIAYDTPYPEPLRSVRPVTQPFGTALLFARDRAAGAIAGLDVTVDASPRGFSRMSDEALERLRTDNPCARALPLLAALAGKRPQSVTLERADGHTLTVSVRPC